MMVVSGHQPVYLPWLGLIHKASLADVFVFMDDVQYLEQDWNNRNRIKTPQGGSLWLTVPVDLKNSSSRLLKDILIKEENLPPAKTWQINHWNSLRMAYTKTPFFKQYAPYFEWLYMENKWIFLSDLNLAILNKVFEWFQIDTTLVIASQNNFKELKSDLVLEHGLCFNADIIVTGALGRDYIQADDFKKHGIDLIYQDYRHPVYKQKFGGFISHLSFVDLLFNHGPESRGICLRGNICKEELCKA